MYIGFELSTPVATALDNDTDRTKAICRAVLEYFDFAFDLDRYASGARYNTNGFMIRDRTFNETNPDDKPHNGMFALYARVLDDERLVMDLGRSLMRFIFLSRREFTRGLTQPEQDLCEAAAFIAREHFPDICDVKSVKASNRSEKNGRRLAKRLGYSWRRLAAEAIG